MKAAIIVLEWPGSRPCSAPSAIALGTNSQALPCCSRVAKEFMQVPVWGSDRIVRPPGGPADGRGQPDSDQLGGDFSDAGTESLGGGDVARDHFVDRGL